MSHCWSLRCETRCCPKLEAQLEPAGFCRVHRATLVNLAWVVELFVDGGKGGTFVRLRDPKATALAVSRDRVHSLKQRLGVHRT
jgi:DNA-binding LytR/AlgR family response regulator